MSLFIYIYMYMYLYIHIYVYIIISFLLGFWVIFNNCIFFTHSLTLFQNKHLVLGIWYFYQSIQNPRPNTCWFLIMNLICHGILTFFQTNSVKKFLHVNTLAFKRENSEYVLISRRWLWHCPEWSVSCLLSWRVISCTPKCSYNCKAHISFLITKINLSYLQSTITVLNFKYCRYRAVGWCSVWTVSVQLGLPLTLKITGANATELLICFFSVFVWYSSLLWRKTVRVQLSFLITVAVQFNSCFHVFIFFSSFWSLPPNTCLHSPCGREVRIRFFGVFWRGDCVFGFF